MPENWNEERVGWHDFGGRSELFLSPDGREVTVGLMFWFKVTDEVRDLMAESGVALPINIDQIDVLSIAPDQSLPARSSPSDDWRPSSEYPAGRRWTYSNPPSTQGDRNSSVIWQLFKSIGQPQGGYGLDGRPVKSRVARTLASLILEVSERYEPMFGRGENISKDEGARKILIIEGHGGNNPHRVGERTNSMIDARHIAIKQGELSQSIGNRISSDTLVAHYDDPKIYQDIYLNACNMESAILAPTRVPVRYVILGTVPMRQADVGYGRITDQKAD